jgi:hypothetical protein
MTRRITPVASAYVKRSLRSIVSRRMISSSAVFESRLGRVVRLHVGQHFCILHRLVFVFHADRREF